jgi:cytochrome P450
MLELGFWCLTQRSHQDDHDIAPILAADLWALNANAIWAVYWLIALHLQKRPERLAVLVAEIDVSRRAYFAAHPPSTPIAENPAALHAWLSHSVTSMPLLTSAIQETLRFTMNSGSLRKVMRDTVLGGYQLRAGARVVCYTRAVHLDEEVHECAGEYEPARYMNAGQVHIKDGRRVANHSMPFGGGVSMCEGRYVLLSYILTQPC